MHLNPTFSVNSLVPLMLFYFIVWFVHTCQYKYSINPQTNQHLKSFHWMKSPALPSKPHPGSYYSTEVRSSRILECVFVAHSSLAIQCWWRAPSHKEAALGMLVYPSLPITQATETDEILFLLYWFLCITVFFLCPWRLPNPIDRVLVLQRSTEDSLYPVIPLTLNKGSRVGGELYGIKARQGHYWKMSAFCQHCGLFSIETE